MFSDGRGSDKLVGVLYGALLCAATRGIIFRPPGSLFRLLIGLATSKRPPISDFLFRGGRGLESVGPAKLFDRFEGIFPGKSWGKHLLQRPPPGAKFRQLRLFPYHLKFAGVTSVPVRLRLAAPRRKHVAPFRFRGFGKSRENSIFAASFLLLPTRPAPLGSRGVPFFGDPDPRLRKPGLPEAGFSSSVLRSPPSPAGLALQGSGGGAISRRKA